MDTSANYDLIIQAHENPTLTEDGKISIDNWVEAQSEERLLLAMERTMRALEVGEVPEEDSYLYDTFIEGMQTELVRMAANDLLTGMVDKGVIQASVTEDGELAYSLTRKGYEATT